MKRLLLPLLTALALPNAVNAESYWLILGWSFNSKTAELEKIEVESMEQCREQGEYFRTKGDGFKIGMSFKCLKGK
tara:strand:+ start:567 stop:794 length:228 start_codon:yes stop_codon:yes gene_type:complete